MQAVHETNRYPRPFGKYILLRQLAIGGMAEVYLARQSGPAGFEKECVIKRILPSLAADQQFVNMFLDEARIAARLSHPNIVQIFDLGSIGESDYFLAMEHVHGVDMQQIEEAEAARGGRIPLAVAVRIASNVAEGLEHAHRATDARGQVMGLVHRDVTPSNVIVSFDGVAKILDFGIAKAVARKGRTEVGVIKGKIPYMSPEQVQGESLDFRSDLFSLGTMLYELTTGHKPFEGEGPATLSMKILHDEPPPTDFYVERYPQSLADLIKRAMSKKPADRFQSARDLHEALDEFLMQSGIRCTSHDVAAYLEGLFPGLRDKARDEAAATLPVEVTDPTVPMMSSLHGTDPGPRDGEGATPLVMGDLSSPQLGEYDDVRRNLSGGGRGGGSRGVIVVLVLAVAIGFYFLATHTGGKSTAEEQKKPPTVTPALEAPKPSGVATKPLELPNPAAIGEPAKPTLEAQKALEPPKSAPAVDKTQATVVDKKAEPTPSKADKPHPKPQPQVHKPAVQAETPAQLPRLPTPPPPDDAP
ncbi:MAG: serine/threonine protein kinase [Myxococcales bacterium]|nr:serine/threonine protein kinase [Myxococcales bacterium]